MPDAEACAVAIVDDSGLSASGKLAAALHGAGLWSVLQQAQAGRTPDQLRIVVKPEFAGFAVGSPTVTDPTLVEDLIDQLHERGFNNIVVAGTADSSALWAENRDIHALSDLLGYRYATPGERPYDIVDLADALDEAVFPLGSALHGCGISRHWLNADVRIVFSKCRTDESAGYALCLDTLIGVLPLTDKDLHYRKRRHPGDVVAALLDVAPVQFCLIDAIVAGHGAGGRRAPTAIGAETIIAAGDIVLADHAGALKMGLDPSVSPVFERVLRARRLPQRYIVAGSLSRWRNWENVPTASADAGRARSATETLDRLVAPWLQQIDPELFPFKHPLDARLNATLAAYFADPANQWLLTAANALLAWIYSAVESYRTLFDKDTLRRRAMPLGFDPGAIHASEFERLVEELRQLEWVTTTMPAVSDELAWRYVDEAVVFRYSRTLPIDFATFVRQVDVARTIQFMNDYLGGVVVALAHDEAGRPVRQAERNIYLPQPNYLVLYQGKPIDVSKLEVVEYGADHHRLYWKTILSDNGSASHDDGIATFERSEDGTRVTIIGKQQFTLPVFFQVFDPGVLPGLKGRLVTHAYQSFFDRTVANLEAFVEGRNIRIGRPVDEPAPHPSEQLMPVLQRIAEAAMPLLQGIGGGDRSTANKVRRIDSDGFVHIIPTEGTNYDVASDSERVAAMVTRFVEGLAQAIRRDLAPTPAIS